MSPGEPRAALSALPLAQGELEAEDARELQLLKQQIRQVAGFFCEGYKEKCLRRRLAVRMRARGVHRYRDYARVLAEDPQEYERLLAAVTINVSKFFRNAEVWEVVRRDVVPALFAAPEPIVRVWSAGAASGEEAYTLAILLLEHAQARERTAELARFRILGTDIDAESLAAAQAAVYPELALGETPADARTRWFEPGGPPWRLRDEVRRMVRFEHSDMLAGVPRHSQRLILCRNVLIYFERVVQERLFTEFAERLVPGGYLVLGKVETMFGPAARRFRTVCNAERIYQLR